MKVEKIGTGIERSLIPKRLGNDILGFDPGLSLESGIHITLKTKTEDPRTWRSIPKKMRRTIEGGVGTVFIDTVGNTTFQASYKIPEILTRNVAEGQVINITPLLSQAAAGNNIETHAAD